MTAMRPDVRDVAGTVASRMGFYRCVELPRSLCTDRRRFKFERRDGRFRVADVSGLEQLTAASTEQMVDLLERRVESAEEQQ